ncbi:MAG TPA: ABC transporter permease [Actinocrinis sp.]|nr:ABC transporter permease [Actinocrinis sp.]
MITQPESALAADPQLVQPLAVKPKRKSRIPRSPKVIVGGSILFLFVLIAVFGPLIAPHSASFQASTSVSVPQAPSSKFWLGTDQTQHDILSLLLAGGRSTLLIAFIAGAVATALSILVGVTAGYVGGVVDELLSLLANIFLALPGLLILMVVLRPLPPADAGNPLLIGTVIALTSWSYGARVLRAQTLALRNQDYVESARVIGERRPRIIVSEVVPNLLPILASSFIFTVIYGIGAYVALAYLGAVNPTGASWGTMIKDAQAQGAMISGYWWWYLPPALCVALVGISLALLNFGIDEIVNPRVRSSRTGRRSGVTFQLGLTPVLRARTAAPRAGAVIVGPGGPGSPDQDDYLDGDLTPVARGGRSAAGPTIAQNLAQGPAQSAEGATS